MNSNNAFLNIFGKNSILEALEAKIKIQKIWLNSSDKSKTQNILELAKKQNINIEIVERKDLDKLFPDQDHRGAAAKIRKPKILKEETLDQIQASKILVTVNIQDPHNLGAIIRSAYAFGIDLVCVSSRNSTSINATVASASAGAVFKSKVMQVKNVTDAIIKLKKNGFWIYGTVTEGNKASSLGKIDFDDKSVILVGNEGKGLSAKLLKHCDFTVHIPVKFNSLNVSAATAVVLSRVYSP